MPTREEILEWFRRHRELTIVVATAALAIVAMRYHVNSGVLRAQLEGVFPAGLLSDPMQRLTSWAAGCVIYYLLIPAAVLQVCGTTPRNSGFNCQGLSQHWRAYAILFVPVGMAVWIVSYREDFQATYPFLRNPSGWTELLLWEACYISQFIALEFFYRGFLVHGLRRRIGDTGAVLVMLFPYIMIHFHKPLLETIGACIAGVVLGVMSLRTGSIAGGAILHVMVAVQMDLLALWRKGWFD